MLINPSLDLYQFHSTPYLKMTTALAKLRAVAAKRKLVWVTGWDFPSALLAESGDRPGTSGRQSRHDGPWLQGHKGSHVGRDGASHAGRRPSLPDWLSPS